MAKQTMKYRLSFLFGSEIRFCSLLIGIIHMLWAMLGLRTDERSLFIRTLHAAGLEYEWFGVMFCVGTVLALGAVFPWRAGRHIGLFLSSLVSFTLFGVFIEESIWTPVVILMPVMGVFSIVLMYADAKRKKREESIL